jgi:arginase
VVAGRIAVLGIPSAAGGRSPGPSLAPSALRQAGLLDALAATGAAVSDLADAPAFPFREDPASPASRNLQGVAEAVRAAAAAVARPLGEGFALLLGGDCSIAAGTLAGARRALGGPVGLIFLDADADLNTPQTTPSGYFHGMALALALGRGPDEVASTAEPGALSPDDVSLVGFRALDPGERGAISHLGLALPAEAARRLGMRATAALALDGIASGECPILVHFDVDVLDPREMPAKDAVTPGQGLSWEEAELLLCAILASPRVVGLEVTEFSPGKDRDGTLARRLVELLARALSHRTGGSRRGVGNLPARCSPSRLP